METPPADTHPTGRGDLRAGQVVTVFRSRLAPGFGGDADYSPTAARMEELARDMPGFVDFKSFEADDGERVSIVTFADPGAQAAWRNHVEHARAQAAGRDRYYSEYSIQVYTCDRVATFSAGGATGADR